MKMKRFVAHEAEVAGVKHASAKKQPESNLNHIYPTIGS